MAGPEGERSHFERKVKQGTPNEQIKSHQEGGNGALGLPRTIHESAKPPPVSPAHEGRQSTSFRPAVFGNCIVRDLMPSSERVDEMVAEGRMTEEQAAQLKKEDLISDRLLLIGDRIGEIKDTLRDPEISTTEKRPLRAEYK